MKLHQLVLLMYTNLRHDGTGSVCPDLLGRIYEHVLKELKSSTSYSPVLASQWNTRRFRGRKRDFFLTPTPGPCNTAY